ncbi:MAG: hypothetical protein LBD48_11730 [Treponema sp.]|jgi:hypothetical protein|nr:hypothetical protein [Treponema sp.]
MGVSIWENRGKLYLDIWLNGRRKRESLGLTLTTDEQQNKEIMRTAEMCRSKREIQIVEKKWNLNGKGDGE